MDNLNKIIGFVYIAVMMLFFTAAFVAGWEQQYDKATFFLVGFHLMAWWVHKANNS